MDSSDEPASKLHAEQAVFTERARFRLGATATLIGVEVCGLFLIVFFHYLSAL
jgi:hypothetical protein